MYPCEDCQKQNENLISLISLYGNLVNDLTFCSSGNQGDTIDVQLMKLQQLKMIKKIK